MMFDIVMMMSRRITPAGPVIAMAYTNKVVGQENFVQFNKLVEEEAVKKMEEKHSKHKNSIMDKFPIVESLKETKLNEMSPIIKVDDSFQINSPGKEMSDISPVLTSSQPLNDDTKDVQLQTPLILVDSLQISSSDTVFVEEKDGPQTLSESKSSIHNKNADNQLQTSMINNHSENSLLTTSTKVVINEVMKDNSFQLPEPLTSDLAVPSPEIKPSTNSWVKLFTTDSKEYRNGSKVVSKPDIKKKPQKEIKLPEASYSQTNSDGWSEVKKKKKSHKLASTSNKVTEGK